MIGAIARKCVPILSALNDVFSSLYLEDVLVWAKRKRISREEQVEFLEFYSSLKSAGIYDKDALMALREEFESAYGAECAQCQFCKEALLGISTGVDSLDLIMHEWFESDLSIVVRTATNARRSQSNSHNEPTNATASSPVLVANVSPLERLLKQAIERREIGQSLRSAFKKPVLMIGSSLLVTYIVAVYAVEAFAGETPKSEWSSLALFYDAMGAFLARWTDVFLAGLVVFVGTYYYLAKYYDGEYRLQLDSWVPGYSYFQAMWGGEFFSIMSVLVSPTGGQFKLKEALVEYQKNDSLMSPYIALHVEEMLRRCGSGEFELSQLDTGLLPNRMKVRLRVAGRSKNGMSVSSAFEEIACNLGKDYGVVIVNRVKGAMAMVNCFTLVLMAGAGFACMDGAFAKLDQFV
jgi:hypothetical protein